MRVAVCQLNTRGDREANLEMARRSLEQAAAQGATLAVLPEYVDYLGPREGEPTPEASDGPFSRFFGTAAAELNLWVIAGSFHEIGPGDGRSYNTSLVFNPWGQLITSYRKIHLFDVEIPGRVNEHESAIVAPGDRTVVVDIDEIGVGLSICYDLRFPELYRGLVNDGARVLVVPAAFMAHTGRDHWEVLLRARAIENQCWVVAAAQIGDDGAGRTTYGRSMVIDPWGTVLVQAPDMSCVLTAELDMGRLDQVRAELPSLRSRRL